MFFKIFPYLKARNIQSCLSIIKPLKSIHQIILDEHFEPSIGKSIRTMLAFITPLLWGMATNDLTFAVWIAITAQVLSNVNVPGSYPLKLLILSGAVLACAVCAALGTLAGHYWITSVIIMMILAFLGGFVRQSGVYGPGIIIAVLLLYLLSLDHPGNTAAASRMFLWVLEGGILTLILLLTTWAFVPFNPFRRSIALTWKALSDWITAFSSIQKNNTGEDPKEKQDKYELSLRKELNNSMELLSRRQAIAHARQNRYSYHLVGLRQLVSEAGNAVSSLHTVADIIKQDGQFPRRLFQSVLDNLAQTAHRIALSIISHRPEDVYTVRLSIEKSRQSIGLLRKDLKDDTSIQAYALLQQTLDNLMRCFDDALAILEKTTPEKARMTLFIRNLFTGMTIPQRIPWVRFEFSSRSFTFRFALRLALGMGVGIFLYKFFRIPHGYWIAMTTMIVLQPEFGATFKKASDRMKGTVLGVIIGTLVFLLHLPLPVNIALMAVYSFLMTYYVTRNYAVAAFFITMLVISLFHLLEPVTWQVGGIRLANTLAGCGLAVLGGFAFWPLWERFRFPALIREAIEASTIYMHLVTDSLQEEKRKTFNDFIKPRREAEMANNNAFLCLRRMEDEPKHKKQDLEQFFIITAHNIRVTRLLNTLNQQIRNAAHPIVIPYAKEYGVVMDDILQHTREIFEGDLPAEAKRPPATADQLARKIREILPAGGPSGKETEYEIIRRLLEKAASEAIAMYHMAEQINRPLSKSQISGSS